MKARTWITLLFLSSFQAFGLDYVLIVDTSGSMRDAVSRQDSRSKIAVVQNALRDYLLALPAESRLRLISFNTGIKSEKEVVLRSESDRRAALDWLGGLEKQTRGNGATYLWSSLRHGLSVASVYSRQNTNQTVVVRVLTDGLDNEPAYRHKKPEQVIAAMKQEFPALDGETIRANLVLLGDLELELRSRYPGLSVSHDPSVQVLLPPIINWEPQAIRTGASVTFFDNAQRLYQFYDWWIDNKPVGRQPKLTHIFTTHGRHLVKLMVAGADGIKESDTRVIDVLEPEKPIPLAPGFTFLPATPAPGETVRFVGWATGQGLSFSWFLNGQQFASSAETEISFPTEGTFEIKLLARDAGGRTEMITKQIKVIDPPLTVTLSAPAQARSGEEVQFAADIRPAERVSSVVWDFGDGGSTNENNPQHKFINETEQIQDFRVTLRASNRAGKVFESTPHILKVFPAAKPPPAPEAAFRVLNVQAKVGHSISFQDESTGLIDSYFWNFNEEGTDQRKNPEFQFQTPGTKRVTLTVRGPGGTTVATGTVTIKPREASVQVNWLDTNGQSIALPEKMDYGVARLIHIKNGELPTILNDTFEILLPPGLPANASVVLDLESTATNVFQLQQRTGDKLNPVTLPASVKQSGRFQVALRRDATEGEYSGRLSIKVEGRDVLLNGQAIPLTVPLHMSIKETGGNYTWLVLLSLLGLSAGLVAWWPRRLAYPLRLSLEEIAPKTIGPRGEAFIPQRPMEFILKRIGEGVVLGACADTQHTYNVNAPDHSILANRSLELHCRGEACHKIKVGKAFSFVSSNRTKRTLLARVYPLNTTQKKR